MHVANHVWAVTDFDPYLCNRRTDRPHRKRDHVHGTAFHAALVKTFHGLLEFSRCNQLFVGPASSLEEVEIYVRSSTRATSLDRTGKENCWDVFSARWHCRLQSSLPSSGHILLRSITPIDTVRLTHICNFLYPRAQFFIFHCYIHERLSSKKYFPFSRSDSLSKKIQ